MTYFTHCVHCRKQLKVNRLMLRETAICTECAADVRERGPLISWDASRYLAGLTMVGAEPSA